MKGIEQRDLKISQVAYVDSVLAEFNMHSAEGRDTPIPQVEIGEEDLPKTEEEKKATQNMPIRNVIGKLWWVALQTRPDIYCALHKCALWQNKPSEKLWKYLMHILRYLRATREYGIVFRREQRESIDNFLFALCDSSFASEVRSKSRYGYFSFSGSFRGPRQSRREC